MRFSDSSHQIQVCGVLTTMNEKRIVILAMFMVSLMFLLQPSAVDAADWELEETNVTIEAGNWYLVYDPMTTGSTFSGYFEAHSEAQWIDFFICDEANKDLWESTGSASVYELLENWYIASFDFSIPYDDTWYAIFSNRDGSSSVTLDIGADENGDGSPYYDPGSYDDTEYKIVLYPNHYWHSWATFTTGSTLSGHVSTWFSTDGVDVFFCDDDNFNDFHNGLAYTRYAAETNMHQTSFGTFNVPYTDTWHLVVHAKDQADTVTISLGYNYNYNTDTTTTPAPTTTSETTTPSETTTTETTDTTTTEPTSTSTTSYYESDDSMMTIVIAGVAIIAIIGIGAVVCSRRGGDGLPPTPGAYDVVTPGPSAPSAARAAPAAAAATILVICPYCGAKTEQGILECRNCGAEL